MLQPLYGSLAPLYQRRIAETGLHLTEDAVNQGLSLAYWMNEGSGVTLHDLTSNQINATLSGDYDWLTEGGRAVLDLNYVGGDDGYASASIPATVRGDMNLAGTYEFWIKPFSDWRNLSGYTGLLYFGGSYGSVRCYLAGGSVQNDLGGYGVGQWTIDSDWTGQWHQIAQTWIYNVSTNNTSIVLYVDGVQRDAGTAYSPVDSFVGLELGRLTSSVHGTSKRFRHFRAWSRALSSTEIAAIWNDPDKGIE